MYGVLLAGIVLHIAAHAAYFRIVNRQLKNKDDELAALVKERQDERMGRTKAEREVRQLLIKYGQQASDSTSSTDTLDYSKVPFPLRPIGILKSCFAQRNGTPRQPLLVHAARAELTLKTDLSPEFLDGIKQYSHCILLYIFHENTDLQRLWQTGTNSGSGVRAKIRVPRLDGDRLGVFATRSPHRPCPIGLSVAQVLGVRGRTLILGGADVVNGTPILDVKPYVPFCDSIPNAVVPSWVTPHADDEPLNIASVQIPEAAEQALQFCWQRRKKASLYDSFGAFRELVTQVLSRDIRSVTQRIKVPAREQGGVKGLTLESNSNTDKASNTNIDDAMTKEEEGEEGKWHVVLDAGIDISYEVDNDRNVIVKSAALIKPNNVRQ